MQAQHEYLVCVQRGFDEDWLGDTFSRAVMLGNGLTAILAGLLANTLVDFFALGPVAPFDAAIVLLSIGGALIWFTWPENYGNSSSNGTVFEQFMEAVNCIRSDERVFLLGLMQVCYCIAMNMAKQPTSFLARLFFFPACSLLNASDVLMCAVLLC
jgi:hypothetical protein